MICKNSAPHKLSLFQLTPVPHCLVFQLLSSPTTKVKLISLNPVMVKVFKQSKNDLYGIVLHPVSNLRDYLYLCSAQRSDDVDFGQRKAVAAFQFLVPQLDYGISTPTGSDTPVMKSIDRLLPAFNFNFN